MTSILDLSGTGNAKHQWAAVSGAVDAAAAWAALTTMGAETVTQAGKVVRPGWAKGIDGLLTTMVHSHTGTTGGVAGTRLGGLSGVAGGANYFIGNTWGGQTTVSVSASVAAVLLNPMLKVTGNVDVAGSAGVADPGNGDATCALRWSSAAPAKSLLWLAAEADDTGATDLLGTTLTAFGGDTVFPYTVADEVEGIRALAVAMSSDSAGAGQAIGQFRFQGPGLKDSPQDVAGQGHGGEAGATSGFAGMPNYWDEWLEVNKGSQISLRAGYTGTDVGDEEFAMGMAFQTHL